MSFFEGQCLKNRDFLEKCETENLQDFTQAPIQPEFLLDDRNKHVNANRDPHLGSHRIVTCTVERLDLKILLDPFEEQFDLPPAFVELGYG